MHSLLFSPETQANRLKAILREEHYAYFASYLVQKRVSSESNFHPLYVQLVDSLKLSKLKADIIDATYESIKLLLSLDKLTGSTERQFLKNLGSWLGQMTLGQGKPLLARKLDLKEIILDAYDNGRLSAVVPFVAKLMEGCTNSKIFKPPNPWFMAVVSLLAEIALLDKIPMV